MEMPSSSKRMLLRNAELLYIVSLFCLVINALLLKGKAEGSSCWQHERHALLDLQKAFTTVTEVWNDNLYNKSDVWFAWDDEVGDCCEWQGVTCDKLSGRVIQLRPPTGDSWSFYSCSSLPPSLSHLEALQVLDLRGGCFSGDLPHHVFAPLTNLAHLDLSYNHFSGVMHLPLLPKLTYFNFSNIQIDQSARVNLSNLARSLPNLRYLDLSYTSYYSDLPTKIPWEFSASFLPHLVYLDLSGVFLQGLIPEQLGTLQSLSYLNLADNSFQNPLPWPSLANLSQLTHLELGTQAGDVLVWEERQAHWQCKWKALEFLSCSNMRFASNFSTPFCLDEPQVMSKLKTLSFTYHVGSIGPLVHSLSRVNASLNLKALSLSQTSLGDLEAHNWLHPLDTPFLESLDLSSNALTSFPAWLPAQLPLLGSLDLSSNSLSEFPSVLQQLQVLQKLDISYNRLNVGLHQLELKNSTQLQILTLDMNKLTGSIPSSLLHPSLSELSLSNNQLSGGIPSSVGNLSLLSFLDLSANSLQGLIPLSIWNLSKLTSIDISQNMLFGGLPDSMENITFHRVLRLSDNQLTGTLPHHLFENLGELDLSGNRLLGTLPQTYHNCEALFYLDLSGNNLYGALPEHVFTNCFNLAVLMLYNTELRGNIPELQNCSQLVMLDLSYNQLTGSIPKWITGTNFPSLEVLWLSNNQFQGSIPFTLVNFTHLQILGLANNNLSGSIPTHLEHLVRMTQLQGDETGFTITRVRIPMKGTDQLLQDDILLATMALDLSNNNLEGPIPPQIGDLKGLTMLNLSHNALIGPIPSSLGNLSTAIESLDLSDNQFTGGIPHEFCLFDSLGALNVSSNRLQGTIPQCPHMSTFNASAFAHNEGLCGLPLPNQCSAPPAKEEPHGGAEEAPQVDEVHLTWFAKVQEVVSLEGLGIGYALGLLLMTFFLHFRT